jgi:hypothetical protein
MTFSAQMYSRASDHASLPGLLVPRVEVEQVAPAQGTGLFPCFALVCPSHFPCLRCEPLSCNSTPWKERMHVRFLTVRHLDM